MTIISDERKPQFPLKFSILFFLIIQDVQLSKLVKFEIDENLPSETNDRHIAIYTD